MAEPWRRKTTHDSSPDLDQEAKAQHPAQPHQRHLEVYRDLHRFQDALCGRSAALLQDKVHSQRLSETARAKPHTQTKQKLKLAFSKLQHNDSYLKSIPKSSYYLIFDLQKRLAECGHLKTHHDLEDFHRSIKYNSSQLHKSLEDVGKKMLENRPGADIKTSEKHGGTAEDGGHRDHSGWRPSTLLLKKGSGSRRIFTGDQDKDENQQMFPKCCRPTSGSDPVWQLALGGVLEVEERGAKRDTGTVGNDTISDTYDFDTMIIPEIPVKSRRAEIYLRRLRQMHNLCLINRTRSQRLLDRQTDSLCWREERGNQDLILPSIDYKPGKKNQTNTLPLCSPKQSRSVRNDQPSCPQQLSTITSASFQTLILDTAVCSPKTPDPLSIEDVCQQKNVEITDCGFKLWRNYTENQDQ